MAWAVPPGHSREAVPDERRLREVAAAVGVAVVTDETSSPIKLGTLTSSVRELLERLEL